MHKYYNPELSDQSTTVLDWDNFAVLMTGQALLGAITTNLSAVVVQTEFESSISVDLVVDASSTSDAELVEDVASDLYNYTSHLKPAIDIDVSVVVDPGFIPNPRLHGRLVYLRAR